MFCARRIALISAPTDWVSLLSFRISGSAVIVFELNSFQFQRPVTHVRALLKRARRSLRALARIERFRVGGCPALKTVPAIAKRAVIAKGAAILRLVTTTAVTDDVDQITSHPQSFSCMPT
ncbi:MAG: hypothetical protein ACFB0F_12750 [Neomegalonema sp.]